LLLFKINSGFRDKIYFCFLVSAFRLPPSGVQGLAPDPASASPTLQTSFAILFFNFVSPARFKQTSRMLMSAGETPEMRAA
jgi:hypothetical protein